MQGEDSHAIAAEVAEHVPAKTVRFAGGNQQVCREVLTSLQDVSMS